MLRIRNMALTICLMLTVCGSVFAKTDDTATPGQSKKNVPLSPMAAPTAIVSPEIRSTLTGFVPVPPPMTGFVAASTLPSRTQTLIASIAAPKPRNYTLTTGATPNRKQLYNLQKKVQKAGIRPVVQEELKTVNVYRLLSSCRDDISAASRERARIAPRSGSPFIIRNNGSYCVVAASLFTEATAQEGQKLLSRQGIETKIATFQVPLTVQRLTIGPIAERHEAEAVQKALSTRGITTSIETTVN